jgi:hypothetical protein
VTPFSLDAECATTDIVSDSQALLFGSRSVYVEDQDRNVFEIVQAGVSLEIANLI